MTILLGIMAVALSGTALVIAGLALGVVDTLERRMNEAGCKSGGTRSAAARRAPTVASRAR